MVKAGTDVRASRLSLLELSNSGWREQGSSQLALVEGGGEHEPHQRGSEQTLIRYIWPAPCALDVAGFDQHCSSQG